MEVQDIHVIKKNYKINLKKLLRYYNIYIYIYIYIYIDFSVGYFLPFIDILKYVKFFNVSKSL